MSAATLPGRVRFVVSDTSGNDQHGLIWGVRSRHYEGEDRRAVLRGRDAESAQRCREGSALGRIWRDGRAGHGFPRLAWVRMLYTNAVSGSAPMTHVGSYRAWAGAISAGNSAVPAAVGGGRAVGPGDKRSRAATRHCGVLHAGPWSGEHPGTARWSYLSGSAWCRPRLTRPTIP